jgi:hypothetical protein
MTLDLVNDRKECMNRGHYPRTSNLFQEENYRFLGVLCAWARENPLLTHNPLLANLRLPAQ